MKTVLVALLVCQSGYGLMDTLSGIERDETGKVVKVNDRVVETASGVLGVLMPGGALIAAVKLYRHKRIVASGGKDTNVNGIPDEQEKSTTTPT